jgi:hypothetical protein
MISAYNIVYQNNSSPKYTFSSTCHQKKTLENQFTLSKIRITNKSDHVVGHFSSTSYTTNIRILGRLERLAIKDVAHP